jgi:hypothetical protein
MVLLAISLTILFNLYICPTEVILRLLHGIQFQVKSLTFGLKRSDKKAKNFEMSLIQEKIYKLFLRMKHIFQ